MVLLLTLLRHGQYQVPLPLYLRDEGETPQAVGGKEAEELLPARLRVFAGTAQEGRHFHPGTRFAAHHRHHRAVQLDALLGQILQVEGPYTGHALPVVPPPALHHQQLVQRTAVHQVAGFEIPGRTVDVPFDVRHQQQVGQQAVAVLHLLPAVAHGNRERRLHGATFRIPDFNVQTDGVVGLIDSLVRTDRHRQGVGLPGVRAFFCTVTSRLSGELRLSTEQAKPCSLASGRSKRYRFSFQMTSARPSSSPAV